jgi:hypothetical protein
MYKNDPEEGGQSTYWDGFTGGLTAKTPRFKISENDPPRPRYSDDWFEAKANEKTPAPTGFIKQK